MTYSLDYRRRVIDFVSECGSQKEACRIFKLSRNTVYRWLQMDDLRPKVHGRRHRKLDRDALAQHVKDYPHMLLRERAHHFGVHTSAIAYQLKQMQLVKKTASAIASDVL